MAKTRLYRYMKMRRRVLLRRNPKIMDAMRRVVLPIFNFAEIISEIKENKNPGKTTTPKYPPKKGLHLEVRVVITFAYSWFPNKETIGDHPSDTDTDTVTTQT